MNAAVSAQYPLGQAAQHNFHLRHEAYMYRICAASLVLTVGLAIGFIGSWLLPLPMVHADSPTVYLTSTLNVTNDLVIRDTNYVWNGPSGQPMILLGNTQHAHLENLTLTAGTGHPSAGIQLSNVAGAGGPELNQFDSIRIGVYAGYNNATMDYGILWTNDSSNGDSNTFNNVSIYGMSIGGVSIQNNQAVNQGFNGLFVFWAATAFRSDSALEICHRCGFIGSSTVDIDLERGGGLAIEGFHSEQSAKLATINAGAGAGGLTIKSGYWQWRSGDTGPTVSATNPGYRTWLRLEDFMVTPLDGQNHGSLAVAPYPVYTSNVWGIAGVPTS